jgi:hypothetical protein
LASRQAWTWTTSQYAHAFITFDENSRFLEPIESVSEKIARAAMDIFDTHYFDAFTQCNASELTGCD